MIFIGAGIPFIVNTTDLPDGFDIWVNCVEYFDSSEQFWNIDF